MGPWGKLLLHWIAGQYRPSLVQLEELDFEGEANLPWIAGPYRLFLVQLEEQVHRRQSVQLGTSLNTTLRSDIMDWMGDRLAAAATIASLTGALWGVVRRGVLKETLLSLIVTCIVSTESLLGLAAPRSTLWSQSPDGTPVDWLLFLLLVGGWIP